MGYKFNPFTGTLDNTGSASITVPGSNTQIIFNDSGSLGADSNLTYNKTTKVLTMGDSAQGDYLQITAGLRKATIGNLGISTALAGLSFADTPSTANYSLLGDNFNTYLNAPSAGTVYFRVANSTYASLTSTLFTVTTANAKVLSSNPILYLENTGANSATSGRLEFRSSGGAEYVYFTFDASANAFRQYYQTTEVYRITSTGQMQWRDGSVSAPAISFYGDTNTGIYRSTSDQLDVAVGGSNMMKVNSSGIGINGNNPGGGSSYIATPSGLATDADYGWNVQNAIDYISTYFRAPYYSLGGGIYGDGKLNFISGGSFSDVSNTPDITIQTGISTGTYNCGNIYIQCAPDYNSGSPGSVNIQATNSAYFNGGEIQIHAGECTSGAYGGGDVYISAGNFNSGYSGTPGSLYLDAGWDDASSADAGYVRIMSYSSTGTLSFFGASGAKRGTTAYGGASTTINTGTNINDSTTFNGYTIAQIVQWLCDVGFLT